jgi:hypothetical protein
MAFDAVQGTKAKNFSHFQRVAVQRAAHGGKKVVVHQKPIISRRRFGLRHSIGTDSEVDKSCRLLNRVVNEFLNGLLHSTKSSGFIHKMGNWHSNSRSIGSKLIIVFDVVIVCWHCGVFLFQAF